MFERLPVSNGAIHPQTAQCRESQLIFVAEDNFSDQLLIARALTRNGYDVELASNGEQALTMVSQIMPAAVVLDVCMPGISGYELCVMLKHDPYLQHLPVIFLSGRDSPEDYRKGMEAGGAVYVSKSLGFDCLLKALDMVCANQKRRHVLAVY